MAITQVSNSLVKQDLTISGGTVDNTVIGSGTPAAGTFTTVAGTLASTVTGTTQAASDNSTKIATTAYVTTAIANLVDTAPSALNTLNELAAALGDDANFATTVNSSIAAKLPLAGGTMTGAIAHSGNFSIDAAGDIHLDADSEAIRIRHDGGDIGIIQMTSNDLILRSMVSDKDLIFKGNDGGSVITALTLDMSEAGAASFNSAVTTGSTITVNSGHLNLASDGAHIYIGADIDMRLTHDGSNGTFRNDTGDLTIDVAGDIVLDADGGDFRFKDAGTQQFIIDLDDSANSVILRSNTADGDMIFQGNDSDGGGNFTALTLDMSAAGKAIFSGRVQPNEHIIFGSTTGYLQFPAASSRAWVIAAHGGTAAPGTSSATFGFHHWSGSAWSNPVNITAGGNVGIGTSNPDQTLHVHKGSAGSATSHSASVMTLENSTHSILQFLSPNSTVQQLRFGDPQDDGAGIIQYDHSASTLQFNVNGPERLRIDSNGHVGIGAAPDTTGFGGTFKYLGVNGGSGLGTFNGQTSSTTAGQEAAAFFGSTTGSSGYKLLGGMQVINHASSATNAEGAVRFYTATGGTIYERMRIRNDGNVGIGSTGMPVHSQYAQLSIGAQAHFMAETSSGTGKSFHMSQNAHFDADGSWETMETDYASNYYQYAGGHHFRVAGQTNAGTDISFTEALRIQSNGRVGINYNNPSAQLHVKTSLNTVQHLESIATNGGYITLAMGALGTTLGFIGSAQQLITGGSSSDLGIRAQGEVVFATNGHSERARITTNGKFVVKGTSSFIHQLTGSSYSWLAGTDNNRYNFYTADGNLRGYLTASGAFTDTSDLAYKKEIQDISYGLAEVNQMQPRAYKMKINDEDQLGFIAQEMEQIIPEVVSGEDGSKGLAYGHLVPVLVKAIQEQQVLIEALQTKVAALEGE